MFMNLSLAMAIAVAVIADKAEVDVSACDQVALVLGVTIAMVILEISLKSDYRN